MSSTAKDGQLGVVVTGVKVRWLWYDVIYGVVSVGKSTCLILGVNFGWFR